LLSTSLSHQILIISFKPRERAVYHVARMGCYIDFRSGFRPRPPLAGSIRNSVKHFSFRFACRSWLRALPDPVFRQHLKKSVKCCPLGSPKVCIPPSFFLPAPCLKVSYRRFCTPLFPSLSCIGRFLVFESCLAFCFPLRPSLSRKKTEVFPLTPENFIESSICLENRDYQCKLRAQVRGGLFRVVPTYSFRAGIFFFSPSAVKMSREIFPLS